MMSRATPIGAFAVVATVMAFGLFSVATSQASGPFESAVTYEIAAELAVSALPPELRPAFESRLAALQEGATSVVLQSSSGSSGEASRHYVLLDLGSEEEDWGSRRAAALRFPRGRSEAERFAVKGGFRKVGSLPWVLASHYRELVGAFAKQETEAIARAAGVVVHFATDTALPFNATSFGHPAVLEEGGGLDAPHLFHVAGVGALHDRLRHEARVWSGRCWPTADVEGRIFNTLLSSHDAAWTLAFLESRSRGDETARSGESALPAELAERAAPLLESRVEEGALLGAVLITSAWIEAGRPRLTADAAEAARPNEEEVATDGERVFVGSVNSTIVHLGTCAHAERINPENRVFFPTASAARSAGRRGCKSCDPYTPNE